MHITRTTLPDGTIRTDIYNDRNIAGTKPNRAYQDYLWQVASKGPKALTPEKWKTLSTREQNRIVTIWERAKKTVNLMKQEVCNRITQNIFGMITSSTPLVQALATTEQYAWEEIITIPHNQLGISKEKIIQRLLAEGIFPADYHTSAS
jgi:hypothetical protein